MVVRLPIILGLIGQKWICVVGVERSTLHRCGNSLATKIKILDGVCLFV